MYAHVFQVVSFHQVFLQEASAVNMYVNSELKGLWQQAIVA
jgi:hypothetical protein